MPTHEGLKGGDALDNFKREDSARTESVHDVILSAAKDLDSSPLCGSD
jgi:hypothetical protein